MGAVRMPGSRAARRWRSSLRRGVRLTHWTMQALRLWRKYRDATMVPRRRFVANLLVVDEALRATPATSVLVECGTWRGGMAAAMAELGGNSRHSWFFDSFDGLPPAAPIDGARANEWQAGKHGNNHDNCRASLDEFMATMSRAGLPASLVHVHRGAFDDVFPAIAIPPIGVLRIDVDWHASTLACLEKFWPSVVPGGVAIIDDYGVFDGCTRAVHEYLARTGEYAFIAETAFGGVSYIRKGARR